MTEMEVHSVSRDPQAARKQRNCSRISLPTMKTYHGLLRILMAEMAMDLSMTLVLLVVDCSLVQK